MRRGRRVGEPLRTMIAIRRGVWCLGLSALALPFGKVGLVLGFCTALASPIVSSISAATVWCVVEDEVIRYSNGLRSKRMPTNSISTFGYRRIFGNRCVPCLRLTRPRKLTTVLGMEMLELERIAREQHQEVVDYSRAVRRRFAWLLLFGTATYGTLLLMWIVSSA